MGNGNGHSRRPTGRAYRTSNPSWGTGTATLSTAPIVYPVFQPLMGNGNGGTDSQHVQFMAFQPLMGNGNADKRPLAILKLNLPTPHGERERRSRRAPARCPLASNPSWGTGTACRRGICTQCTIFQPLMGNGNSATPWYGGRNCRPSNPSWGTGTIPEAPHNGTGRRLPTPHGERERHPPTTLWKRGSSSNPSWGTGTTACAALPASATSFQPLMGNGNDVALIQPERELVLPTPHGERERGACPWCARGCRPSNPSWGTGTCKSLTIYSEDPQLPTPHGERELPIEHIIGSA